MRGLIGDVSAYEELAVEAAVRGGRSGSWPRCSPTRWSASTTWPGDLADRLIAENLAYLPWTDQAGAR